MASQFTLNHQERKIVGLSALGGMLEFYDFIIYGIFSVYFAHQFFPSGNELISIIQSYVVFVLGYVARPIGGMIFSHVGDEKGRKKVLIITIILMGISSLGIGLLPTYEQIGMAAPIALLFLRLLQGLALGGELPSTFVYVSETMPNKRGSGIGLTMTGVNSGLLLGMVVNELLNFIYTKAELIEFGWRIPFIFGGILCLVSYKIRKTLQESAEFTKIADKPSFPLAYLFKTHSKITLAGIAMTGIMSGLVVTAIIFMPTYLTKIMHVDSVLVSHIMPVAMLCNVATIFLLGFYANYSNPHLILRNLIIAALILAPTSYFLIANGYYWIGSCILAILEGAAAMVIPLIVTYLFPAKIRLTGVALSYNIGFSIFGGLAPIIISSFIELGYDATLTPIVYIFVILVICAIGLFFAKTNSYEKIN
jgi:MFS family permease